MTRNINDKEYKGQAFSARWAMCPIRSYRVWAETLGLAFGEATRIIA